MHNFAALVLNAPLGKTHIFSVGQAGFIIKSKTGQLLAIDLYLSECVERVEGNEGFKRLLPKILAPDELKFDIVITTHPHLDHFDIDAVPMMMGGDTKLLCSVDCKKLIDKTELGYYNSDIYYCKPGDKQVVGDFNIEFVNCDHGEGAPDAVGVVVKVDGYVFYEAGDTCLRLDRIDELPNKLDVLIAPINGEFGNLNEIECAQLSAALKPRITIPCHYGMFASHKGNIGNFYDIFTEKKLPFLIMCQGEKYTL